MSVISPRLANEVDYAQIATKHGLELFGLGNRRYLGSKSKLLGEIDSVIVQSLGRKPSSVMDAFAGSGVVAAHFAHTGSQTISSDLLLQNIVGLETFLNHTNYDYEDACDILAAMSNLKPQEGYITEVFGGKYFSIHNANQLDAAREFIHEQVNDAALRYLALTSLIYAADKVAQTVGHYDAFFNRQPVDKPLAFRAPMPVGSGRGHKIFHEDANSVVASNPIEILYLDPPYNSRQYSDAYHVLENIVRWEKPEVFGVARKMDRTTMKSKYSTRSAHSAFHDLITTAKAELIVLSYSNTGSSRASRSNNVLTDDQILSTLSEVGEVRVEQIDFKEFSVGRTSARQHQERLFICQVGGK